MKFCMLGAAETVQEFAGDRVQGQIFGFLTIAKWCEKDCEHSNS